MKLKDYQVRIGDVNIGVKASSIKEAQKIALAKVKAIEETKKAKDEQVVTKPVATKQETKKKTN